MNFLTGDEIKVYAEEHDMIYPHEDPLEQDDRILEDIKYPLTFSGTVEERMGPGEGGSPSLSHKEVVEIPPRDFRVLQTNEEINLWSISRKHPIHIVGILYLPNRFVRAGIYPYFQGIVDPGWSGGKLHIVLHNANTDRKLVIEEEESISYISFCYIKTSRTLSDKYRTHVSKPDVQEDQETYELHRRIDELSSKYDELLGYVQESVRDDIRP